MKQVKILPGLVVSILMAGCVVPAASTLSAANPNDERSRLEDLFDREWEFRLESSPLFATSVDRHEWNHLLPDVSPAALGRQVEATRGFLAELAAIDRATLERTDQVNYDIFRRQLELRVASHEFSEHQIPLNADSGFHTGFARLGKNMPFATVGDYENYIARLLQFADYARQQIDNMKAGLERGMVLPKVVLRGIEGTISSHVVDQAEDSVFWGPFAKFPETVSEADRARLSESGGQAILEGTVPGYAAFLEFMTEEYIPGSRDSLGASELPDGADYYRYTIRDFTTLDLTAAEIHQIGRAEVARIRAEMEEIIEAVEFEGSFDEFLTFLRTDPRFYVETPEALLKEAAWIAKRMDGKLPALFKTLPRLPYTVEPVPDYLAPKYTTGRYVGPPLGSVEPGRYWVNTYNLPARPLYNLEALSLHEAVPGHHLQISLNRELEGLPNFRRFSYISAFGEGWGLYSEWLGLEAGFYTDPYSNFGRLTYEMWRACRLVVDTGIHAMGWTRQRVMDFLASNTALPLHEIETETDRYISWPGQALSYKLGELEIKKLRKRAEARLGEKFDVREFHDAVLLNGSVPLPVLEENIDRYIESKTMTAAPSGTPVTRVSPPDWFSKPRPVHLTCTADLGLSVFDTPRLWDLPGGVSSGQRRLLELPSLGEADHPNPLDKRRRGPYTCIMTQTSNNPAACCSDIENLFPTGFFKALGDPNRIALMAQLATCCDSKTVSELSDCCPTDLSVVSRHLATLRDAGIVESEKRGREVFYRLRFDQLASSLRQMADAIEECCAGPGEWRPAPETNGGSE